MLSFSNLRLRRGPRVLIDGLSATIHRGQRVGFVGRNGTGKSSLFALIQGEISPDQGDVSLPRNLLIASVAQEMPHTSAPAIEYVLDGDAELRAVEADLREAEILHDANRIGHGHERLHAIGGYAASARAARMLDGLGFKPDTINNPVDSFSGGWRMRLNLARVLMTRADLLLLDEPTNHLDIDAVVWLQNWLLAYEGTLLLISHDREFLDAVCTHTLHLAESRATLYTGNYSQFERLRADRLAQQAAVSATQQRTIAHLQSFVDRFKASAAKARQAQSRVKMIERIKLVAPVMADSEFSFDFPQPDRLPSPLIRLHDAAVGYGERTVLSNIKLSLEPGQRIGLVGPNGEGKSTLVKLLAGELDIRDGEMTRHPDLRVGYFAQHQLEQLNPDASPLEHFRELDPKKGEQELRSVLGGFNFVGDRVFEKVAPFSGGEKARLALAMVVYRKPNLLLLDEPTNHLDLDMRQALELALQDFNGAVVLVSHDRHLVGATCDQLIRVCDGAVGEFDGDLDDYARWLSTRGNAPRNDGGAGKSASADKSPRQNDKAQKKQERALREALKKAEVELEQMQKAMQLADAEVAAPGFFNQDKFKVLAATQRQTEARRKLDEAEARWLAAAEAVEALSG
ncbi:MAG: ATP-binding cassette domain-containing protein [Rhodanobacteraceae bacterium]|nr:ATP-binding cassette domain-containing protein [Rhodanobacteraceae bacterium]MBP9154443.1 ATP-binding cassette domain-containing protein [Xanthomonadales bacterium]